MNHELNLVPSFLEVNQELDRISVRRSGEEDGGSRPSSMSLVPRRDIWKLPPHQSKNRLHVLNCYG